MTIMITLNQIRAASPCAGVWKKVLKAHEHLGIDTPFPLSSVLDSNDLADTLWCFRVLPDHINIPKRFAIWCVRQVQHLMTDDRSVNAIDVAERYLDGNATLDELKIAIAAAADAIAAAADAIAAAYAAAIAAAAAAAAAADAYAAAIAYAAYAAADAAYAAADADMRQKQIAQLREMIK
jgi:hypothetical protein